VGKYSRFGILMQPVRAIYIFFELLKRKATNKEGRKKAALEVRLQRG
jgi:hypothetical protein